MSVSLPPTQSNAMTRIRVQAIPEQLELVATIPRNASGKITKNVLRDALRELPFHR